MIKTDILNQNFYKYILFILLFLLVSGCGGGGGSSGGVSGVNNNAVNPPSNPNPPTESYDEIKTRYESNNEYRNQWGLAAINASAAYARGATGAGITIGITDSGLDSSHDEISSTRLSSESNLS